ncbi:MAG: hypothetical protein V6Z89_11140 [Desulfobacter sp.]
MKNVTIGFSIHRPEILLLTAELMARHAVIFLEEPPDSHFKKMLARKMGVDDYLMRMDLEYPEFSRGMCRLERELYQKGKTLIQTDPFVEVLVLIHEEFARGKGPQDLEKNTMRHVVYQAERNATGALLHFYKTSMTGTFKEVVSSVRQFARADAARLRLRDSLRAQDIARHAKNYRSIYIEAGMIHYGLWLRIRQQLKDFHKATPIFLDRMALQESASPQHCYSPGDQLTLAYVFHPALSRNRWESLLAARSIVYSKIVQKEEHHDSGDPFFHLKDERNCICMAKMLSMADCEYLYPRIRHQPTNHAFATVQDYIQSRK